MWNVDVRKMCDKHLLGEHVEMHMFVGCLNKNKSINGYLEKGLVEVHNIKKRHDEISKEMLKRKINHKSPLNFNLKNNKKIGKVNKKQNEKELRKRCKNCKF